MLVKVVKRSLRNSRNGALIKTEIVRVDTQGNVTITSYPAGTEVPDIKPISAGK